MKTMKTSHFLLQNFTENGMSLQGKLNAFKGCNHNTHLNEYITSIIMGDVIFIQEVIFSKILSVDQIILKIVSN